MLLDSAQLFTKQEQNSTLNELRQAVHDAKEHDIPSPQDGLAPRLFKSFLYGSAKTKQEVKDLEQSFSKQLMRGKYVHEIVTHKVLPGKSLEYLDLV